MIKNNNTYKRKQYVPPIIESYDFGDGGGVMHDVHSIGANVDPTYGDGNNDDIEDGDAKGGMVFDLGEFQVFDESDYK